MTTWWHLVKMEALTQDDLLKFIEENQIGYTHSVPGPYGNRRIVYTDYTASARALGCIEHYIEREVLPVYANTHTATSHASRQTTYFREEARDIIRNAVNASVDDVVIFTGNGCTGVVHTLIHAMDLASQPPVMHLSKSSPNTPNRGQVVLVGPFEHHSNLLPWRELGAEIIWIEEDNNGGMDEQDLKNKLKQYSDNGKTLIGSFSAASNLTGVLTDTIMVSALLHQYGAYCLWDYASAAPYVKMDMNPVITSANSDIVYKDAMYFSMHKFIGGVGGPGVLVAKKHLFTNKVPGQCGGGTVFFVTSTGHQYLKRLEEREEGGTPNIVGCIRAGLAMQLKQRVSDTLIMKKEEEYCNFAFSHWSTIPGLIVLGPSPDTITRLPIFSLILSHPASGKYLHHNFVCSLLTDLFGIQVRGGCSCAGPYAQNLLGINVAMAKKYEELIMLDSRLFYGHTRSHEFSEQEVLRPGMTRLCFPYFMSKEAVEFVVRAVSLIAERGWRLLPQYMFDPATGLFRHATHHPETQRVWLSSFSFDSVSSSSACSTTSLNYQETLQEAERILDKVETVNYKVLVDQSLFLSDEAKYLRWFLLPSEAQCYLVAESPPPTTPPPFVPKVYTNRVVTTGDTVEKSKDIAIKFHHPPRSIFKATTEAIEEFDMIQDGDRVLVCLSGGKDSLSLLHTLKQYQYVARTKGVNFDLGAVTVNPKSSGYDPSPLIPYLATLETRYFFEEQSIIQQAADLPLVSSICSFCSRMKRGKLYACARREQYNVLAFGQHLDDLTESFLMSVFHNGLLRTMKANYIVKEGDLRVIRPFVYVREKDLCHFAKHAHLPVIAENCPACFTAPKERQRTKQLLAAQELLFPNLFHSMLTAMKPLMARRTADGDHMCITENDLNE